MGFSTSLQGQASHEALLGRQDAEIKLLETMRRCLTTKVKSDREYAATISSLTLQGKKIERSEDLVGSLIAQSWKDIMDSIDQTAKLIKQQADSIESIVIEHISVLYSERRRARKVYQEEQAWLNNQFQQLTDDVVRKKMEYQKNLEVYKLMRSRFEEHYIKSGRGGRKLDEVREKYQKACRKLHLTHNEYVLLLGAVTECEHDLRTCYLPSLLRRQQAIHQEFITSWKGILHDIVKYSDFTTDKFLEIHARMQKAVDTVKPIEEYRDFIGKHKFEGPTFPSIQELIRHQWMSGLPVTSRSGAILKTPILRERWELNNDDVILLEKIGRGNFGDVYKAQLKTCKTDVAVKTCKVTLPDEQKRKFLQEGRILKQYDHPNIVKLIGICVQKQPIMIVMELVPGGSLLTYLRKNASSITQREQLRMCKDAAAGMRYLESKYCIHRDLAARNCLVGYESIVKISDFGMSREEEEYIVSDGMKQIPIKWTAPEALNFGKYTSLCDVWSYGVLMWEIFSKGGNPYSGMSNSQAREKIDAGYRMPAPENTPDEIYRLMLRCWEYEPEKRPHFDQIYTVVETLSQAYL
ncbi:hypothetical protein HZH68_011805 [Vespula germanica]|uniref:non-specific protein-tyrosine kinase n=1 Tax=Vespula germanica TaxID=30212 RepID=A0A834JK16_VESGE|nr:hypothetical protein HZH68_011805 [Vespula germanica]